MPSSSPVIRLLRISTSAAPYTEASISASSAAYSKVSRNCSDEGRSSQRRGAGSCADVPWPGEAEGEEVERPVVTSGSVRRSPVTRVTAQRCPPPPAFVMNRT